MRPSLSHSFFPLGDTAVLIDFGNAISKEVNAAVLRCFYCLHAQALPFVTNLVPAYASLTVHFNPAAIKSMKTSDEATAYDVVVQQLESLLKHAQAVEKQSRLLRIPVCYEAAFAPDLETMAAHQKLPTANLIALHTAATYHVYMLGFLPGFAYMGEVDERIALPRRQQPRKEVAAGSVGIAGRQTGVYSLASPGGWNIIGRTPLELFDAYAEQPVLLQPGDSIQFYSITAHEFAHHQSRIA